MTESDREAFERAILAAPEDDAPRLIYADWLDERGDAEYARKLRTKAGKKRVKQFVEYNGPEGGLREWVVNGVLLFKLKLLPLPITHVERFD